MILGSNVVSEKYLQSCYKCDFASKSKKGLHDHITKHHDESNFPCNFCGQKLSSEKELGSHVRQKHQGKKPRHVFRNGSDNQIARAGIYSHFFRQHADLVQGGIKTPESKLIRLSVKYELMKCEHCNFQTNSSKLLVEHKLKNGGESLEKCNRCDFTSLKYGLEQHMKCHINKIHCKYCDFSTVAQTYLNGHIQRKHKDKLKDDPKGEFKCTFCDYASTLLALGQHTFLKHRREGVWMCRLCAYQSKRFEEIRNHKFKVHGSKMKRHPVLKKIKCKLCNYKTDFNWRLKAHQLKHNVNQLEKCSVCEFSSIKRQHMKKRNTNGIEESDR